MCGESEEVVALDEQIFCFQHDQGVILDLEETCVDKILIEHVDLNNESAAIN